MFKGLEKVTGKVRNIPPSGIIRMITLASQSEDVVKLHVGQPDFDTPAHVKEAAKKAIDENFTKYTQIKGIPELRNAIAQKLKKENKLEYDPNSEIIVSMGATQAIYTAIATLAGPGDEVLHQDPCFVTFIPSIRMADAAPVPIPLKEENSFELRACQIEPLITKKTKILIVNSPHNPTGSVISEKEQTKIADLAVKNDLIVISDEVYEEFVYDGKKHRSIASLPEMKERTLVVNSFSKTFSMPGWRIGYVAGNKEIIDNMSKLSENIITAPASISQIAALKALEGPSDFLDNIREEYQKRRDLLLKELNEMNGISCKKTSGAFYVFPNIQETGYSSLIFAEKLVKEAKVLTVPGSAFGEAGEGYLRISYAATIEDIREGIRRIRSFVKELS